MRTVNVKIQYKNGNTAVVQVPMKQASMAMFPGYKGNIVEMTPAAVKSITGFIEEVTGERPDKAVMYIVDLVEKGKLSTVLWTNGIKVVNKY